MPTLCIRVLIHPAIGSGHCRRCLSIARSAKSMGVNTIFLLSEPYETELTSAIRAEFLALLIPFPFTSPNSDYFTLSSFDALVVSNTLSLVVHQLQDPIFVIDSYHVDQEWIDQIRSSYSAPIVLIDDIFQRGLSPDLLINSAARDDISDLYQSVNTISQVSLFGPAFVPIDPSFLPFITRPRSRTSPDRLSIYFGSTYPSDLLDSTLEAICLLSHVFSEIHLLVGILAEKSAKFEKYLSLIPNIRLYSYVDDMALFYWKSDLALGCAGSALWERISLRLPSITFYSAPNQLISLEYLHSHNQLHNAGSVYSQSSHSILESLESSIVNYSSLSEFIPLVDGLGADRIVSTIMEL